MAISQSYVDGLTRQFVIRDYILNGMFPCQSDIVRSIRSKKRNWEGADRFEYRMLLATTNTGGTLNSQTFNRDVSLRKPAELTYGIFKATYGTVHDGFDVDMTVNLETSSAKASFLTDYAAKVHSMRVNTAALFKQYAINGRYGVIAKLDETTLVTEGTNAPVALPYTPTIGRPFTIAAPINVYASGFKTGRLLIKTIETAPWGAANVQEVYMVLDNQPRRLTLVPVGQIVSAWAEGQYLETFGNRTTSAPFPQDNALVWSPAPTSWDVFADPRWGPAVNALQIMQFGQNWGSGVTYTSGAQAGTGAMEGLSDLFPWYIDASGNRMGLDLPFRNQPNRLMFSTEQAGGFYVRQPNESIIDAIMNGVALTTATVPHADIGVWMNPDTMLAIAEQETQDVTWVKQIVSSDPLIYQRGITSADYRIGSKTIPGTLRDHNLPTDVVVIGPRDDIGYNAWDNAMSQIDDFIHETWSSQEPPKPDDISLPADFVTKLDFSRRIVYGSPNVGDRVRTTEFNGGNFIHPANRLPIAFYEMGALFTEAPFAYTVVHLRRQIIQPSDVNNWAD